MLDKFTQGYRQVLIDAYPNSEVFEWGVVLDRSSTFTFLMRVEDGKRFGQDDDLYFECVLPAYPLLRDKNKMEILRAEFAAKFGYFGVGFKYSPLQDDSFFCTVFGIPEIGTLQWDTNPYSVKNVMKFQKKLEVYAMSAIRMLDKLNAKFN